MTPAKKIRRQSSKPIIGWLQKKLGGSTRMPREPVRATPGDRPRASTLQQLEIPTRRSESNHIVLNDDDSRIGRSTPARSSRSSTWSPNPEADDDASIRPLPPTSPPSPAPSRSSSSYLSDPRTFKSMTASTKPTTLLSIDLSTNGMAHIAQAPSTPTTMSTPPSAVPHFSTSTTGGGAPNSTSITFSALPPTSPASRSESSHSPDPSHSPSPGTVQAPLHTSHHPRYNPRPASPPQDNASVLTLASSAFAFPGGRMGGWLGDSQSQFALDSNSQHGEINGELEAMLDEAQVEDASVRALRPRSSRRGSWESEASGWSARVAMVRERSLKASSWKTGPQTDGDGSTEITGEEVEESKGIHGPSPLAAVGFTQADALVSATEEEGTTPPAKAQLDEIKFLEVPPNVTTSGQDTLPPAHGTDFEHTPKKKTLLQVAQVEDSEDGEEDVTQKTTVLLRENDDVQLDATRTSADDVGVAH